MNRIRVRLPRKEFELDVDLELPGRGIVAVLGASGSGKTTLLRCVAGLERPAEAFVQIEGDTWHDSAAGVFVPTWQRPLGYVFQEASLFAHLDVRGNIDFARKRSLRGAPQRSAAQATDEAISLLGIGALLPRRTSGLSGGERQRVAIARALATQPRLLLLDEPLAAVDAARRRDILPWLERLRDESSVPMLYVTHAAEEAARLADHLVVLDGGRAIACGPLGETLTEPRLVELAEDEAAALLQGTIRERDARWHLACVRFDGGEMWLRDAGHALGDRVRVRVLARDVSIARVKPQATSIQNLLGCEVRDILAGRHPSQVTVRLACGASTLLARITARAADALQLAPGAQVWAQVKSAALVD